MQPLKWYAARLRCMSAGEVAWRAASAVRDQADRVRFPAGLVPRPSRTLLPDDGGNAPPPHRLCDLPPGAWAGLPTGREEHRWAGRLRRRADALLVHRFTFFDLEDRFLGDPIDWNRDHSAGIDAPRRFSPSIDYRDFRSAGDAKLVWEPNRHHHLVVLARAWRAFGDDRYAREAALQIGSWLDQCPFGTGMNWRSPLELAIRLINWCWAHDLLLESGVFSGEFRRRFLHAAYLHLWEARRKYSRGSSANNHVIGEAAGVFIGSLFLPGLAIPPRWTEEARRILEREAQAQTCPCGCNREHAYGYHLFVLQFLLLADLAGRKAGVPLSGGFRERVGAMLSYTAALSEGGLPPAYGDSDDGYVLDLGSGPSDAFGLLPVGAALLGSPTLKAASPAFSEPALWLLGEEGRRSYDAIAAPPPSPLASRAFPDAGYYLLQSGTPGGDDRISVFFDCAGLGFGPISAHGHADALSFTVRAGGEDLLVDPGTFDYFTHPEWRNHFRGTASHNAAVVDGEDQSVMEGPFLWGARARSACLRFDARPGGGGTVSGEHDGYGRLPDPVLHRRTLSLEPDGPALSVIDAFESAGSHHVALHFHLAEGCSAEILPGNGVLVRAKGTSLLLDPDPRLAVRLFRGDLSTRLGWVSRAYHRKVEAWTVRCEARWSGSVEFRCLFRFLPGTGSLPEKAPGAAP